MNSRCVEQSVLNGGEGAGVRLILIMSKIGESFTNVEFTQGRHASDFDDARGSSNNKVIRTRTIDYPEIFFKTFLRIKF